MKEWHFSRITSTFWPPSVDISGLRHIGGGPGEVYSGCQNGIFLQSFQSWFQSLGSYCRWTPHIAFTAFVCKWDKGCVCICKKVTLYKIIIFLTCNSNEISSNRLFLETDIIQILGAYLIFKYQYCQRSVKVRMNLWSHRLHANTNTK